MGTGPERRRALGPAAVGDAESLAEEAFLGGDHTFVEQPVDQGGGEHEPPRLDREREPEQHEQVAQVDRVTAE